MRLAFGITFCKETADNLHSKLHWWLLQFIKDPKNCAYGRSIGQFAIVDIPVYCLPPSLGCKLSIWFAHWHLAQGLLWEMCRNH